MRSSPCLLALLCGLLPLTALSQPTLLWGDTHLHTTYSSDAFANNNLQATPDIAFRYARGEPVVHPYHQARVQIETPLDFLVVSDHAEFMGVIRHTYFEGANTAELGLLDSLKAKLATWVLRRHIDKGEGRKLFVDVLPEPGDASKAAEAAQLGGNVGWIPPMPEVERSTWKTITDTAESYNQPGEFTALIGWEWSSIPGGANLHRVVVSDANATRAQTFMPFGLDDSPYPEDLWAWLDATSVSSGVEFVAIPHNSNISKGYMFDTRSLRGEEMTADYADTRRRWEPIAEITQIKGDSETHPALSPDDPFADFETYPYYIQRYHTPYKPQVGDYLRPTLGRGLELEARLGLNPYQLGVIGSTDAHTALPSAEEDNFHGKMATDSIPSNKRGGWSDEEVGTSGWAMSASGLAAIWAEDNTRGAIIEAMRRREVYATTGPRIRVGFFAGREYPEDALEAPDVFAVARAGGVPMGGELGRDDVGEAPQFLVQALRDPLGANLDRIQIIKGWLDPEGKSREKVFNVAWSGGRQADANGRLPPVGNSVDPETGQVGDNIGAGELSVLWQDPEFDPERPAFYYARVLQVPTARHSLLDAMALGEGAVKGQPDTIQERAYTSAIWYRP